MSEQHSTELAIPATGELVNLDDPRQVAFALDGVRDLERQLRSIKAELTRALVYESEKVGSKTIHMPGVTAVVKSGPELVYDGIAILEGLRAAGMPDDRINDIVKETVSYKVDAVKAKHAAGANPRYAAVIEANVREEAKPATVVISLARP